MYPELTISSFKTSLEEADRIFPAFGTVCWGASHFNSCNLSWSISIINALHLFKKTCLRNTGLIGLTPNQLVKLIVAQILLFITYSIVAGSIVGCTLTYPLAMIDYSKGALYFDVQTITMVSVGFIVLSILLFAGQGWLLTRQKIIDEIH
ncbi:hypothetical protein [Peribacillus sp. YIM B13482]|uniref:hypothetical protein n=1 Tax=Peribacillus sp. YIM B13482 TaxID=3366298 RepID=UPI00366E1B14